MLEPERRVKRRVDGYVLHGSSTGPSIERESAVFKAIIIIVLVAGALFGGLLVLRRSGRTGMPDEAVLQRAAKRAREQAAEEEKDGQ